MPALAAAKPMGATKGPKTVISPAALLVIDLQQGLDDPGRGARNNPGAEQQIPLLLPLGGRRSGR